MEIVRAARPSLVHWGEALLGGTVFGIRKALGELDWQPEYGLEAAYRDSYEEFRSGGRKRYEFDFSQDDAVLDQLAR
jgi:hypothetical protein